jgi:hypothetical protein
MQGMRKGDGKGRGFPTYGTAGAAALGRAAEASSALGAGAVVHVGRLWVEGGEEGLVDSLRSVVDSSVRHHHHYGHYSGIPTDI